MIQMIAGVYGLPVKQPNGKTRVVAKGPNDGPFSIAPEREAELVARHMARYVEQPEPDHIPDVSDDSADVYDPETGPIGFDEIPPEEITGIPEYNEAMKASELREIGAMCGLTFKVGMKKAEMVAALDKYIEENTVDGVEVDENGEIAVDDDEPAPTFDASEAVL